MCGIVGYIGSRDATEVLLSGLERLEYRGYDSAGVAVMEEGKLCVRKAQGKLSHLRAVLEAHPVHGTLGVGHTRWATHGEPSQVNSHPHTDIKGEIAVVHNGIIENYAALKAFLEDEGCAFISETDTEVIAHLLNFYYRSDLRQAIAQAMRHLEGSYALGIVCEKEPDAFYCVRKDSPLVVGLGTGENFIASDIPAILPCTRQVMLPGERQIVRVTAQDVSVYDEFGHRAACESFQVDWDVQAAEKGGYPHFMLKEIHEQPRALADTFGAYIDKSGPSIRAEGFITEAAARRLRRIVIVACGTAYHAGMAGARMIEEMTDIEVKTDVASEFRYRRVRMQTDDLMIVVSQSGETADTLSALREGKRQGAYVLAVTNVVGSSAAREAHSVLYTRAGPEIAVASTKAYSTQLMIFALISLDLAQKRGTIEPAQAKSYLHSLEALPEKAEALLTQQESIQRFAARHFDVPHVFYIGRGIDYALAMEGSLKLKEISYIFSEAYAAGELKHGTIALIEPGTLVVALLTQKQLREKMRSNIKEVRARGAQVLGVAPMDMEEKSDPLFDTLWLIPETQDCFAPMIAVIVLQLFAYYMAASRGCDVDQPRNLAKSVTVE